MNAYTSSFPTPYSNHANNSSVDSFVIRKAQSQDLGKVAEVLTHSFHSCQGWGLLMSPFLKIGIQEDIRGRLNNDRAHYACLVAIAEATRTVAGTVELGLSSPEGWIPKQYESTYISNLAVSPNFRRQGIAKRLLRGCEQTTLSWGYREIYLHVLENNLPAQKLYEGCGYRLCRVEPSLTAWLFHQPRRLLLGKSL